MKKVLSGLLSLALLACLAVVPASAADPKAEDATLVWDFSDLKTGVKFGEGDDTTMGAVYDDKKEEGPGGAYSVEYETGKGVKITNKTKAWSTPFVFDLSKTDAVTDWTGGTEVWYYVDATGSKNGIKLDLNLFDDDEWYRLDNGKENTDAKGNYYIEQNGKFLKVPLSGWRHVDIAAGYKGWVRIELNQDAFLTGETGTVFHEEGTEGDGKLDLSKITRLGFYLEDYNDAADVVYVKEIRVLGAKGGSTGNQGGNTGNEGGSNETTKTPGSTTGEAAPIAAAVTVVLAAGAVVALRKRAK